MLRFLHRHQLSIRSYTLRGQKYMKSISVSSCSECFGFFFYLQKLKVDVMAFSVAFNINMCRQGEHSSWKVWPWAQREIINQGSTVLVYSLSCKCCFYKKRWLLVPRAATAADYSSTPVEKCPAKRRRNIKSISFFCLLFARVFLLSRLNQLFLDCAFQIFPLQLQSNCPWLRYFTSSRSFRAACRATSAGRVVLGQLPQLYIQSRSAGSISGPITAFFNDCYWLCKACQIHFVVTHCAPGSPAVKNA